MHGIHTAYLLHTCLVRAVSVWRNSSTRSAARPPWIRGRIALPCLQLPPQPWSGTVPGKHEQLLYTEEGMGMTQAAHGGSSSGRRQLPQPAGLHYDDTCGRTLRAAAVMAGAAVAAAAAAAAAADAGGAVPCRGSTLVMMGAIAPLCDNPVGGAHIAGAPRPPPPVSAAQSWGSHKPASSQSSGRSITCPAQVGVVTTEWEATELFGLLNRTVAPRLDTYLYGRLATPCCSDRFAAHAGACAVLPRPPYRPPEVARPAPGHDLSPPTHQRCGTLLDRLVLMVAVVLRVLQPMLAPRLLSACMVVSRHRTRS